MMECNSVSPMPEILGLWISFGVIVILSEKEWQKDRFALTYFNIYSSPLGLNADDSVPGWGLKITISVPANPLWKLRPRVLNQPRRQCRFSSSRAAAWKMCGFVRACLLFNYIWIKQWMCMHMKGWKYLMIQLQIPSTEDGYRLWAKSFECCFSSFESCLF